VAGLKLALAGAALVWPAVAIAHPIERWTSEIAEASARFAVPEAWIRRVMRAESGGEMRLRGRPVVSRAGAMGLMQLMPATWREMRAHLGLGADPFEPHDNILAGAAYLRRMYDRFGYPGLFAAYNAGPARYAAALSGRRTLPAETRAYVERVTSAGRRMPGAGEASGTEPRSPLFALAPPGDRTPPAAVQSERPAGLFVRLNGRAP
jgi:soluble lytic murein transglycosylase-like protein